VSGQLAGRTVIDATSGNTGIALAWLGATLGFPVELCVPANVNRRVHDLLETLGVQLVLTDPLDGTDGAQVEARKRFAEHPDRYYHTDQYSNAANWLAHYDTTGPEIWMQTGGRITHLVCGLGTTGTLVGCSRRLREMNPFVEVIGVQPDSPYHVMEGLKHLPTALRPKFYDPGAHQRLIEVRSEEAIAMARRQARNEIPIGWSAGAALAAAEQVARGLDHGLVVAVLPDGAWRYLGDPLWNEEAP
jgi:cysteine synthase B